MTEYVLKRNVVNDAFWRLASRPIHNNFPGYLAVIWLVEHNEEDTKEFEWGARAYNDFYDRFFAVEGGSVPYLKPFSGEVDDPRTEDLWFGSNLAGTLGVGHINSRTDLSETINVEDESGGGILSLRDDHVSKAKEHLLHGGSVSANDVAMFLYRDFVFEAEEEPEATDAVEVFKDEFGYEEGDDSFEELFDTEDGPENAFEEYND